MKCVKSEGFWERKLKSACVSAAGWSCFVTNPSPLFRSLFDSLLDPAGPGRTASPADGVCHWPASEKRQRGGVESHQSISDWSW